MKPFFFFLRRPLLRRSLLVFCLTGSACFEAHGQLLGGIFDQQSRKKELMVAQIAAYQLYRIELGGGTNIAQSGLKRACDLKSGTLGLHTGYFNSLKQVAPVIQKDPKVRAIAGMEQQIIEEFDSEIAFQQKINVLTAAEQSYIRQVYQNLLKACKADLSELRDILGQGKLQLTDEQRLERAGSLHASMQDKLAFAGVFTARCHKLALGRQQAAKDRQTLRKLYGGQR